MGERPNWERSSGRGEPWPEETWLDPDVPPAPTPQWDDQRQWNDQWPELPPPPRNRRGGGRRSPGVWVAVGGVGFVLVAVVGLVVVSLGFQVVPANEQPLQPGVEIAAVSAQANAVAAAAATPDAAEGTEPQAVTSQTVAPQAAGPEEAAAGGSTVGITLRNHGAADSLVTQARFHFREAFQLARCSVVVQVVPEVATGEYDVTVPIPPPTPPFTLDLPVGETIPAGGDAQFAFTVGAAERRDIAGPWVYLVDIELTHDQGEPTTIESVAIIDSEPVAAESKGWPWPQTDGSWAVPDNRDPACMRETARVVRNVATDATASQPELTALNEALETIR